MNYDTKVFQSTLNIFTILATISTPAMSSRFVLIAFATHAAKLKPRYVKNLDNSQLLEKKGNTLAIYLKYQPNPLDDYDFIYRSGDLLYLNNNAFIYPSMRQNTTSLKELWPIKPNSVEAIKDASGDLYLRFSFLDGKKLYPALWIHHSHAKVLWPSMTSLVAAEQSRIIPQY